MATDKPRYTISVEDELFEKIEDYRFDNRYATRSAATAVLIRLGLEAAKGKPVRGKADLAASADSASTFSKKKN